MGRGCTSTNGDSPARSRALNSVTCPMKISLRLFSTCAALLLAPIFAAQERAPNQTKDAEQMSSAAGAGDIPAKFSVPQSEYDYIRREVMIPMRDGVRLFTV